MKTITDIETEWTARKTWLAQKIAAKKEGCSEDSISAIEALTKTVGPIIDVLTLEARLAEVTMCLKELQSVTNPVSAAADAL